MKRKEIWKDVIGYEGEYLVSNYGVVKSVKRIVKHSRVGLMRTVPEKIISTWFNHRGYVMVSLHHNGKKGFPVHILVAKAFIPNPENKPEVNHKKGNKQDNRSWMLEWNTRAENHQHALNVLNAFVCGEKHIQSKLTEKEVRKIIELHSTGKYTYAEIARIYKMEDTQIRRIVKRISWKHLKIA